MYVIGLIAALAGLAGLATLRWLRRARASRRVMRQPSAALACQVPPFRISLVTYPPGRARERSRLVAALTSALTESGYLRAGDYRLPEIPGVALHGFVSPACATLAVLYEHPRLTEPVLDVLRLHRNRQHVLITTARDEGLETPPTTSLRRFAPPAPNAAREAVARMHGHVLARSGDGDPVPITAKLFPTVVASAYAAEMDWRIERGGVTVQEIGAAAAAGGWKAPDARTVAAIQARWRNAIDTFVRARCEKAFLATGAISADDWERVRDRVLVVHQHADVDALVEVITHGLADGVEGDGWQQQRPSLTQALRTHLTGHDPVAGFEVARDAVPGLDDYACLGTVSRPWRAEFYLRTGRGEKPASGGRLPGDAAVAATP